MKGHDYNMFNNDRHITKGVKENIPLELQVFMWNCIDTLKSQGYQLDYLQIFKLTKQRADDILFQMIEHGQKLPEYLRNYNIFPAEMVDAKVFIIDDGTSSTMLLAEEY